MTHTWASGVGDSISLHLALNLSSKIPSDLMNVRKNE